MGGLFSAIPQGKAAIMTPKSIYTELEKNFLIHFTFSDSDFG